MTAVAEEILSIIPGSAGTSSGGDLLYRSLRVICIAGALSVAGTHSAIAATDAALESTRQTNSGVKADSSIPAAPAIMELRRLSGMTWEQLAKLFDVSRRTVHFWASGKALNAANEERLYRVLSTIRQIDRGSAQENRDALFTAQRDGVVPIDLLYVDRYSEVVDRLGYARPQRVLLTPLSPEARASRTPMKPEILANALQGDVHRNVGRRRIARAIRAKNKPLGDDT